MTFAEHAYLLESIFFQPRSFSGKIVASVVAIARWKNCDVKPHAGHMGI